MIRHPLLLACEALCALCVAAAAHFAPMHSSPAMRFTLSAVGERELADGNWRGVDLLAKARSPVDRFQLTISAGAPAQLAVDVVGAHGIRRLYPAPGQDGHIRQGISYALPGPHGFYDLIGRARIRISLRPLQSNEAPLAIARPMSGSRDELFQLSDGSTFFSSSRAFAARNGGQLELVLQGQNGEVTPSPTASE